MRRFAIYSEPFATLLFIFLKVPFAPVDVPVAFEREDVSCDTVQEPPVVTDHDDPAGIIENCFFECAERIDVEIVGRFVQEQQIGAAAQQLREVHSVTFPARKIADLLLLIGSTEIEPRHVCRRR